PACARIVRDRTVAVDDEMAPQVFRILRPAMPLHIGAAGVHGPRHICDLAADEGFIPGLADAERYVGLAFGQIKGAIADQQFNPETGITLMEGVDKRCPPETIRHA